MPIESSELDLILRRDLHELGTTGFASLQAVMLEADITPSKSKTQSAGG